MTDSSVGVLPPPPAPLAPWRRTLRLLGHLTWWDMVSLYFGSWAGLLWNFVMPAVVILAYLAVFELTPGFRFGGRDVVGGFGVNLVAGLVPWLLFQEAVARAASAYVDNRHVLAQIPVPAPLFPLANVLAALARHGVALALFAGILVVAGEVQPGPLWLLLPLLTVPLVLLTAGCAQIVACLTVSSRDVAPTVGAAMLPLFFATPVIYPPHIVPPTLRLIMDLNPLSPIVLGYRDLLVTGRLPMLPPLAYSLAFGVLTVAIGALLVRRLGPELAERL